MIFAWLLLFIPVSVILAFFHVSELWIFLTAILALIPLADYVRQATDQLAKLSGSSIGGLLNVTFGNFPELILAFFILRTGQVDVVKAQITGAIIGNSLLGLGLAVVVGSWGRPKQTFRRERAGLMGSLLMIAVIALLLPALFHYSERAVLSAEKVAVLDQKMSTGVSIVLILVYVANLAYTLYTHRDVFASTKDEGAAKWSLRKALGVMALATLGTAIEAELIAGALEHAAASLGVSAIFIGVILVAVAGNVSEYFSAVYFAHKDRMGMAVGITLGSTIQIALLVAPILVLFSGLTGHSMNLVFSSPLELIAIAGSAFAVNAIAQDGETTWFEGVLLLAVYALFCIAFLYSTR